MKQKKKQVKKHKMFLKKYIVNSLILIDFFVIKVYTVNKTGRKKFKNTKKNLIKVFQQFTNYY